MRDRSSKYGEIDWNIPDTMRKHNRMVSSIENGYYKLQRVKTFLWMYDRPMNSLPSSSIDKLYRVVLRIAVEPDELTLRLAGLATAAVKRDFFGVEGPDVAKKNINKEKEKEKEKDFTRIRQ